MNKNYIKATLTSALLLFAYNLNTRCKLLIVCFCLSVLLFLGYSPIPISMYGSVMSLTSCINLVLPTPDSLSGTSNNNRKAEIRNVLALTMAEILQNILQTGMVHDNGVFHDNAYWLGAIE